MRPSDDDLREALRHESPPDGFAERVLARARSRQLDEGWRLGIDWLWPAVAAAVVMVAVGSAVSERQARRAEGERAKADVLLALRVTGEKLRSAQTQVQESQQRRLVLPEQ
jgi:hypothetical protein